ncbi:unnamed protein product, partial [Candidula unifasciata]
GVCCQDGQHCCPPNTYCDMIKRQCYRQNKDQLEAENWILADRGFLQKRVSSGDVICPGGAAVCPDDNTCCQLSTGDYGCCPLPEATCCSDHTHCCPQDYKCNVTAGTCTLGTKVQDWLTKTPAKLLKDLVCKDNSHCPAGTTCCELESGQYGCCPLVSVVCPGGKSQCPDGTTCCKMKSGGYGCCPYQLATCCSDGIHCCPEGFRCDLSAGFCVRGKDSISWSEKFQATPINATVTCKDSTVCPNGNTCCELGSSHYGCCPLKEAVCCSDHTHCCPQGYQCDVLSGTCNKGSEVLAWLTGKPSRSAQNVSSDCVFCRNGSVCPDDNTCCLMTSGEYGCCNMPGATCCSDHTHCCPHGYSCNVTANICHWGNRYGCCPSGSLVCPGGRYTCPKETTCCKTQTEEMGCCPLNSATCCADGAHCCPFNFQCNLSTMTCFRGTAVIKLQVKLTATPSNVTVSCNNSTACLDIYTCCDSGPSRYGCCPMREAVCCSDHIHCCPQGYHCDVSAGTCIKGSETVAWLTRKPARSAPNVQKGD